MEKLRLRDAAYAIDATPKELTHWLVRGQVTTHDANYGGGWAEFSDRDVVHLALVRAFTTYARSSVQRANTLAQMVEELVGERPDDDDPLARWKNKLIYLTIDPTGREWTVTVIERAKAAFGKAQVVIDPHEVIEQALARAAERRQGKVA